ncbi:MAG: lipid-A-disaccharide synthase [Candidatus Eisenbacteria bacterium]
MGRALTTPPPGRERRLLVVAGEASGDHHAANLLRAFATLGPWSASGVAGPRMRAAGVSALVPQEELAVIGFSGVIAKLPLLVSTRSRLLAEYDRRRPDAVVLVDYPGFNLRLGPELKRRGARVYYYIAPQVWAWHPERAGEMARWVDRLAVVFPFEEAIFHASGVPTTFVGHPLLDDLSPEVPDSAFRHELGVEASARLVGLLPGSRAGELRALVTPLLEAAQQLRCACSDVVPVLALAHAVTLEGTPARLLEGVRVVQERTRAVQAYATCCVVASGTATLETALFGTPLVIVYKVGWLNHAIAKRVIRLPYIGLPNIVAGRMVAPELLQDALTPSAITRTVREWLDHPSALAGRRADLAVVRERLGGPGASMRAAAALAEMIA